MKKKKRRTGLFVSLLLLVGLAGGAYGAWQQGWIGGAEETAIDGVPVRRGPLRISELVRGNLKAKDSVSLRCELERRTTVLYLIEEGTLVKEGDLVAELDVAELSDRLVTQEIALQSAHAAQTKANEQYGIQEIQNQSDIAAAQLELEFANLDREKYLAEEGEWVHELQKAEEAILLKEEALAQARTQFEWTEKLYDEGFAQRTDLDKDRFSVERSNVEYEQAVRDRDLKQEFEFTRRKAELDADLETKKRDLEKTRKQAIARLADYEAARNSARAKLELEQKTYDKLVEQIGKGELLAPVSGMVVYARERSRWGGGEPMQEGAEVRERQEIVTIPREGGMIAEASLHETVLKKVGVGQPCVITIDAIPGGVFTGNVGFVAVLADSNGWMSDPNQRVYRSEITINDGIPEMRPGMSCSIEIVSAELEDTLYVPIQSVFIDGGKPVCFVSNGRIEKRTVEVGLDNSKWVAIKSGLEEGEVVMLSAPVGFTPAKPSQEGRTELPPALEGPEDGGGESPGAGSGGRKPWSQGEGGRPKRDASGASGRPSGGGGGGGNRGDLSKRDGSGERGKRPAKPARSEGSPGNQGSAGEDSQ